MPVSLRLDGGSALPSILSRRALLVLLCAAPLVAAAAPLKLRTVAEGSQSGVTTPLKRAFRSAAEWDAFKTQLKGVRPAAIDWQREMLLAVFVGQRPSSGYRVRIAAAEPHGKRLRVRVEQRKPSPDAITATVITTPYHLVAVPRHPGEVTWSGL